MIFVTVGTDGPFDRLVRVVDRWARQARRADVFAQIGNSAHPPTFIKHTRFLEPPEFRERFSTASLVVSHAGMGTILTALQYATPLLVMPRRASLGEQRNDHQLATARRLVAQGKLVVAFDDEELSAALENASPLTTGNAIGPHAQLELVKAIQDFIHDDHPQAHAPQGRAPRARKYLVPSRNATQR